HTRFSRDWSSDVCSSDLGIRIGDIVCTQQREHVQLAERLRCSELRVACRRCERNTDGRLVLKELVDLHHLRGGAWKGPQSGCDRGPPAEVTKLLDQVPSELESCVLLDVEESLQRWSV